MALSDYGEALLEDVNGDDTAFTAALDALLRAAPEHREAICAVETAAGGWACSLAAATFELGVKVATEPARWLMTV